MSATPSESGAMARWSGGVSPFGLSWQKAMMWLFIISDALLFAGFLAAYGFNRLAADAWPDRAQVFHMNYIAAMTFVLITSSATMATAVGAAKRGDKKLIIRFMWLTVLGGLAFLGMQAYEWVQIIGHGASPWHNPFGGGQGFTAFFFMITGLHGTHVLIGVIINLVVSVKASRGTITGEGVELAGLYWHFVDLVWVFVFGLFYLV